MSYDVNKTGPGENTRLQKWVDPAMFAAEPVAAEEGPRVYLLAMTADPLAAIAATCKMYKGEVVRDFKDVTHAERREYLAQVQKTKLQMPFEAVQFHFMIEGVTRAFTHQMVRQRTAAYAQQSDRFAVQENGIPVALPPSLAGTTGVWEQHELSVVARISGGGNTNVDSTDQEVQYEVAELMIRESDAEKQRWAWDQAVNKIDASYGYLVANGMPQEDARGLLPTNLLTRLHYVTNLRGLLDHGGNRLCTQAQFEWRLVFARIIEAIRNYNPYAGLLRQLRNLNEVDDYAAVQYCAANDTWQYEAIADMFKPVCYLTGKCEFKANFDRACSIRNRVDANQELGRSSDEWGQEHDNVQGNPIVSGVGPQSVVRDESGQPVFIGEIRPAEWLLNPGAAR